MSNRNNKQSNGLFSNAFGVAKKFSSTGLELLNHVAPESVAKVNQVLKTDAHTFEGTAKTKSPFSSKKYDDPQQMLREHLPNVSRQLLGRHFNTANNVANFVAPQFTDKVSDYFFDHLNQFSNDISSVDVVLDQAGVRDLEALTQDVDRSHRISKALGEQNKWIASIQGALSGATGLVGTAVDIPASLILALRTIYQVGRSYGFDLNKDEGQDIVQHIFRQIDLGLIAEKQALLLALKALSSTLKTHDISQLQNMLGSSNDFEALKRFFSPEPDGTVKWEWLNQIPKVSVLERLSKLMPVASAGVGAIYSRRFVDDVNQKAQEVFSHARQYIMQHENVRLSPIDAYQKSMELLSQATPKLLGGVVSTEVVELSEPIFDQEIELPDNENISQVKVVKKSESLETDSEALENIETEVSLGLEALAEEMVEPVKEKGEQQPALASIEQDVTELSQEQAPTEGVVALGSTTLDQVEKVSAQVNLSTGAEILSDNENHTNEVVTKKSKESPEKP